MGQRLLLGYILRICNRVIDPGGVVGTILFLLLLVFAAIACIGGGRISAGIQFVGTYRQRCLEAGVLSEARNQQVGFQ